MIRITLIGLISGLFLGLLLVLISAVTGYPLDTVLLDLSYIPVLNAYNEPFIQWLLHLFTAVIAAFVCAYIYFRVLPTNVVTGAIFGLLTSLIYFVLQPLAVQELSGQTGPILLWFAAHALYGIVLILILVQKSQ